MSINGQKLLDDAATRVADMLVNGAPAPAKKIPLSVACMVHLDAYKRAQAGGKVGWKLRFREELRLAGVDPASVHGLEIGPTCDELRARRVTRGQALRSMGLRRGKAADGMEIWE